MSAETKNRKRGLDEWDGDRIREYEAEMVKLLRAERATGKMDREAFLRLVELTDDLCQSGLQLAAVMADAYRRAVDEDATA